MSPLDHARQLLERGQLGLAERAARALCAGAAPDPAALVLLAEILERAGRHGEALPVWIGATQRSPPLARAFAGLGSLLLRAGQTEPAVAPLEQAIALEPRDRASRGLLIQALHALGRLEPLAAHLEALAEGSAAPGQPLAQAASASWAAGDLRGALRRAEAALAHDPAEATALTVAAAALSSAGRLAEAAERASRLVAIRPEDPSARRILAEVCARLGRVTEARDHFDAALAARPDDPRLLWSRAATLPVVCQDPAHEEVVRAQYRADLDALEAAAERGLAQDPASWCDAVRGAFALHYTGGDLVEEQRRLGRLIHRVVVAAHPACQHPPPRPRRPRLRVGVVCSTFRRHTVPKLFAGWWEELDRARFEVVAYDVGLVRDAESARLAARCDAVATLPGRLEDALARIRADAPDALLFPEIGMDARVMQIAAARLAPVQAVAWGHPVTTGLPTVDLFLSSGCMAPEPERPWTTEERVDLPGLGICYRRPAPPLAASRSDLGLPEDRPLLLCVQSLFKYRPGSDALHVALAQRAPEALLVFIEDRRPDVTAAFVSRLGAAFGAAGLEMADHVRVLPRLSEDDWMRLLAVGDLFCDSPDWSGGNTTLEALALHLPCLAFPGETMRGRHALGMLRELEIPELCPPTPEAWVERAAALARDPAERGRLRELLRERVGRLYGDDRTVRALEALLLERVPPGGTAAGGPAASPTSG